MDRQATFLWMQDLLEHLVRCHEQWQGVDHRNESFLIETMRRDVEELRRLCDSLRGETAANQYAEALVS